MAAGGTLGAPDEARELPAGDQRSLGRRQAARRFGRGGYSLGGFSDQTDEEDRLKYINDVGRDSEPRPRKSGFAGVSRR